MTPCDPPQAAGSDRGFVGARARHVVSILASFVCLGTLACGPDTDPMGPDMGPEEGFVVIEGDPNFATNSVSWTGSGTDRFSFISVALEASTDGPSHFLYEAPFHQRGCLDARCFPSVDQIFVLAGLSIENLDLSPAGNVAACDGRRSGDANFWSHTYNGSGEARRHLPVALVAVVGQ